MKTPTPEKIQPAQQQLQQPGIQSAMNPQPQSEKSATGSNKLKDKVAIITGATVALDVPWQLLLPKRMLTLSSFI